MTVPILATKFFIPAPGRNQVSRPRLLDRLQRGTTSKLTLVSAPAGFGKTSLLSEWISQCGCPASWVSLDQRDNDLVCFWRYFVFGLKEIDENLGELALRALQSPSKPFDVEALLTELINDITAIPQDFVIVLDDYHVITESEIQDALLFLIENQPRQMHLIIASRADPPWPLSRLRGHDEILEIRTQEMRFTRQEAAAFLNDAMGLRLIPENIAALEKRTEGWIAGLQMAAISMKEREDIAGFIQSFTGSHRFVMDYLVEEVLNQQTPEIRTFLLKTSILDRLTGSLCDVVTDGKNSQLVLQELEQKNLFLLPLDEQRRWFRYHHLFADLLRIHLRQTHPDDAAYLHQRASIWYGMNNLLPEAIRHALAAKDIEGIIHLTRGLGLETMDLGGFKDLLIWLNDLPETDFYSYPWLWIVRARAYFKIGNLDLVEADLEAVENLITPRPDSDEMRQHIQGHIAAIRTYLAEIKDDPHSAIQEAENALALLPKNEINLRAYISIRRANCLAWLGDFKQAIPAYKEAGEASKQIGDGQTAIIALSEEAVIQMVAGDLKQAVDNINNIYHYAENLALQEGRRLPAMGILYRHISHIKRELNELPEAQYSSAEAVKVCKRWGEKEALAFGLLALTRVQFALGDYQQVDQNLALIMQVARQISPRAEAHFQHWVHHFQLLQGETAETAAWAEMLGLAASDRFGYEDRYVYQNYARLLAARGHYQQALNVIQKLHEAATAAGDMMLTIQYKVLQAAALLKINQPDEALQSITVAISLARAGGYVRSFLDECHGLESLLQTAIAKGIEWEYARKLLAELNADTKPAGPKAASAASLVDPLSGREMDVLRLLVTDLSTPEIAEQLIISVSTVRSHIKHIYSKLDAHSRYEAVTKAQDLNLL